MSDSVIDLIIRIKNGYMAKKEIIENPSSRLKEEILTKLQKLGYIKSYKIQGKGNKKYVTIELRYEDGVPALTDVRIYSRPGRRWYVSTKELKPVLGGLGYSIITTPKGILTGKEAKKAQVGGELLFEVW